MFKYVQRKTCPIMLLWLFFSWDADILWMLQLSQMINIFPMTPFASKITTAAYRSVKTLTVHKISAFLFAVSVIDSNKLHFHEWEASV